MIHDDSTIAMAARTNIDPEEVTIREAASDPDPFHCNDGLDDVFGSAPGSPTFPHSSHQDVDIFQLRQKVAGSAEISDIPRLKEKHETEGYRDGVTKGKAESVQKGFDEGYSLGAILGLRIGEILGIIEGIYNAVQTAAKDPAKVEGGEWEKERERIGALYEEAKGELKTENVFARKWWGEDGIWRFEVEGEGGEVTFREVTSAHPLVGKWEGVMRGEVERWGLDLGIMGHVDEEKVVDKGGKKNDGTSISTAPGAAKELAW